MIEPFATSIVLELVYQILDLSLIHLTLMLAFYAGKKDWNTIISAS